MQTQQQSQKSMSVADDADAKAMIKAKLYEESKKNVLFCKRKKQLILKSVELCKLCDQDIFFVIFDK